MKYNYLLLIILGLSSCTSKQSVSTIELTEDKMDKKNGFNAILIIDLKIIDKSGEIAKNYSKVSISADFIGNKKKFSKYLFKSPWKNKNLKKILSKQLLLQALSGKHNLLTITFSNNKKSRSFPLKLAFKVPKNGIGYLGKLILIINKDMNIKIKSKFNNDDVRTALENLREKFPILYHAHKHNMLQAKVKKYNHN
jgi:hypothetical protein